MQSTNKRIKTYQAEGAIAPYSFVKFGSDSGKIVQCGANEKHLGIYQGNEAAAANEFCEVALIGGGAELKLAEALSLNDYITSTAAGLGEQVDAASEVCGAIAMEAGAIGDIIAVEVVHFVAVGTDA